jgi:histone H3/H4
MDENFIKVCTELLQPVIESGIILAGNYMKGCGRNTLTANDVQYAMRYSVRNFVGKHTGTLFPEDEDDSDSDSNSDSIECVDEEDEPFTRYTGDDQLLNDINQANDTWETWIPESPIERMLKDSIDKTY